jgi:hypothetical protein
MNILHSQSRTFSPEAEGAPRNAVRPEGARLRVGGFANDANTSKARRGEVTLPLVQIQPVNLLCPTAHLPSCSSPSATASEFQREGTAALANCNEHPREAANSGELPDFVRPDRTTPSTERCEQLKLAASNCRHTCTAARSKALPSDTELRAM